MTSMVDYPDPIDTISGRLTRNITPKDRVYNKFSGKMFTETYARANMTVFT